LIPRGWCDSGGDEQAEKSEIGAGTVGRGKPSREMSQVRFYIHTHAHTRTHAPKHAHTRTRKHAHAHAPARTYTHTHVCIRGVYLYFNSYYSHCSYYSYFSYYS
jgi:hypothetical protein